MPDEQPPVLHTLNRVCDEIAARAKMTQAGSPPTTAAVLGLPRDPVWPVWVAPLVAGVYYLALRGAFAYSVGGVVFDASDVNLNDMAAPQWGSHWIYRTLAEIGSLAFGTFVAAGIARQRAKAAAITGAIAISIVYFLRTAFWLYIALFDSRWETIEPWPQHLVEAGIIIGGPCCATKRMKTVRQSG
jgi:hypothetical protein